MVTIFRGVDADLLGLSLSQPYEVTDVDRRASSRDIDAEQVTEGIERRATWTTRG